jgi:pyruvate formate lyase activating enzyme
LIAQNIDPIEKKPLYHLCPGSLSYSVATVGCNFHCLFCQNADIAQMPNNYAGQILGTQVSPRQVVAQALNHNCRSIAYTYTEPTVYFEFAYETARLAHREGLLNVFVTNGYMSAKALDMIAPYLDAANVDLKAFSARFYKKTCRARLAPVLDNLKRMRQLGILVEVTTLIIPGLNDDTSELRDLATFIAGEIGPQTPWHISRFHPTYQLTDRPATPVATLQSARQIGMDAGLQYVYLGNVPGAAGENTYCPGCRHVVIDRWGFQVHRNRLMQGRCPQCQMSIYGLWE